MIDLTITNAKAELVVKNVYGVLNKALELFGHEEKWHNKGGGVFCLGDAYTGLFQMVRLIGNAGSYEKLQSQVIVCQEKSQRLALSSPDMSSWQSRIQGVRWGGAIRINDWIFSFSGLPELGDEAIMLKVAHLCLGQDDPETTLAYYSEIMQRLDLIAALSRNPYWVPLRDILI